jgi:autotransporter passenger strand-loop-strand repeat protein
MGHDLLAQVYLQSGGVSSDTTLSGAGSALYVFAGGTAYATSNINGQEYVDGGVDYNAVGTGAAAEITVENGGIAYNPTISETGNGGFIQALSKGTIFNAVAGKFGELYAEAGTIDGALVASTAQLFVSSGGVVTKATIENGGSASDYSGTFDSGTILAGGQLHIEGSSQDNIIYGSDEVYGGGHSVADTIYGTLTVFSPSTADKSLIEKGGFEVLSGGSAQGTQLDGGNEAVLSGGVDQAATINSGSRLGVDSGGMANLTAIKNGGYEGVFSGGTAGNIAISAGGTLEVDSGGILLGTIDLGGTLIINDLDQAIVSFGGTGELVFDSMYFYSGGTARITNDTLIVKDNGTIFTQTLTGNYSDYTPVIEDVSLYGVDVVGVSLVSTAPCFAAGTRILTPRGEIAVENLVIGEMVITKDGEDAPIKWIGKRKLDLSRHPHPEQAQPIFFEADCLADGVPSSELILSPDHALYLDGVLVPAKALVNGQNIRHLNRQTVTYHHIELERHSIIFAESTPVETYLETGNRGAFENGTDALTLHPDLAQTMREEQSCAPFVETGPVVWAIRIRTLERQYSTYKSGQRRYNA